MIDNPQDNPQPSTEDLKAQLLAEVNANDKADMSSEEVSGAQSDEARMTDDGAREPKSDTDAENPPNPEPSAEAKERARDEHGKFVKKEEVEAKAEAKPEGEQAPEKPETTYSKAVKDEQRLNRNRKEFEEEKAAWRQKHENIEREVAQLKEQFSKTQQQSKPSLQSAQFQQAADEFVRRGRQFYKDGEFEKAEEMFAYSEQAVAQAGKAQQGEYQEAQSKFNNEWQTNANAVIKEVPEYGDPNSDASKEMMQLLQENPLLGLVNDGFKKANEILTLRRQAAKSSGLEEENTKLKQEVDRLTKLTTPLGGKDTAKHSAPSNISDLPLEQQKSALFRQVEMADAA